MQVFGGHGYIRETGMEQLVRDTRITMIYEGTTGIQGLDLLGRKILQTQGPGLAVFLVYMEDLATRLKQHESLAQYGSVLQELAAEWQALAESLAGKAMEDLDEVGAAAVDFLFYSGYLTLAYCWGRIAETALLGLDNLSSGEAPTYLEGKLAAAKFYYARVLPRAQAHKAAIEAGAETLMGPEAEALGPW